MKKWLKSFVALTLALVMVLSCMNLSLSESGTLLDDNITVSDTGDDVTIGDTIGDNTTGDDTTGDDTAGDDTTGDDTTGDDTTGDDTAGDDTTGDDTTGDDTTGDDTTGDDATGDDTTGDDTTGDDTTGDDTTGDDTTGDDTTGDDTTGDDTTGDDTTGDDTTGDDTTGDDTTGDDNTGDNDPEVVKTIASATVTSAVYNTQNQKPVVTVKDSEGATLTAGTDYTVSGEFKDAGEYTITIQGIGDYADSSLEKSFVIEQAEFSGNVSAALSPDNGVFTGEKHTPKTTVTGIGETLVEGKDYEVVCPEIVNVGEYTIQINGLGNGNYKTGTLTATYKVTATGFNATIETNSVTFSNQNQKPVVQVTDESGKALTEGTDYTVTMDDQFVDAKSYKITVTGNGNYAGTKELTYTIKPYADFTASLETAETVYNTKDQKPVVKVKAFEKELTEGTDYTVTMDDQFVDAKSYKITVTGNGNYAGTKELTYTIKPYADFTASLETAETVYNTKDQKPVMKVKAFEKELTEGTDYTVTMDDQFVDAKEYTITVTGKGNYTGIKERTYIINPYAGTLTLEGEGLKNYVYNTEEHTPTFHVKIGENIVDSQYYDVKWSENVTDVGTVTITVTGKGNCEGATGSSKFDIIPDESPLTVTLKGNSLLIYNGEDQKPEIKSVVNEKGLEVKEYTVIYPDDVKNVGDKTVTVKGVGNFEGATGTVVYVIDPYELTEANVEYTDAFVFNGGLLQPDVDVTYDGTGEVEYTIELPQSINVNNANETYQGKVTGQNNFTGTVDVVYTINWLGTPDNAITLVGTMNEENGWYYGSAVECTPAAGYTLVGCKGGDHVDCVNNTVALTNSDGDGVTNIYHLKNGSGQLTAPIAVPPYKQDTKIPQYTVKMNSNSSAKISVTASDEWTGAVIKLMYNGKEEALVDAGIDGRNQEIVLDYTVVVPGEYELRIYDHAGNEMDFGTTYKQKYGDNDGDGLADAFEAMWGSDVNLDDTDADGLSDKDEYYAGTEPTSVDSDGDGLTDAEEVVKFNTDPRSDDGDKDGIKDIDSVLLGNYYANDAKKAPTALNIGLNNKLNKTAGTLTEEELFAAVKTLEENGYLMPAAANLYENYNKTNVEREDGRVNMTKGADMRMVNADAEKSLIYGVHVPTGLFAAFELSKRGDLEPVSAISLPEHFGEEELAGVSVVSDDNASIFVIGNWDEAAGKAVSDLIVYLPGSDVVWTIADTEGASRFDVSPDGRMIAYEMDGKAYVLDLITGNPLGLYEAQCDMLAFTADGKLITSIKDGKAVVYTVDESTMELARSEEAFSGVIHEKQPTMNSCVLKLFLAAGENELMPDGGEKVIATNGHVTSKNRLYSLAYMTNDAKRAIDFRFVFGGK